MEAKLTNEQTQAILEFAQSLGIKLYPINPKRTFKFIHDKAGEGPFPAEIVSRIPRVNVRIVDFFLTQEVTIEFLEDENNKITDEQFLKLVYIVGKIAGISFLT